MIEDRALRLGTLLQGGKYQIVEIINRYHPDTIAYVADHNILSKQVEVRELHQRFPDDSNDDGCRAIFLRKLRRFFEFSHPNIEPVIDLFEENGTVYYVVDCFEGERLSDIIARTGPLDDREVIKIMEQLCSAISYMCKHRVAHCNICTENIIRRSDGHILLTDFAIRYGEGGVHDGTPAPSYNFENDIYMLGVVLHKITTGKSAPNFWNIAEHGIEKCLSLPDGPIRRAIEASMRLRSSERIQSVEEFAEILGVEIDGRIPQVITTPINQGNRNIHVREIAPNNYMVLSFFALLLCVPLGIVAIYKASEVDGYWNRGDRDKARTTSRSARNWAIVGIIVGILLIIAYIVYAISQMDISYQYTYYEYR